MIYLLGMLALSAQLGQHFTAGVFQVDETVPEIASGSLQMLELRGPLINTADKASDFAELLVRFRFGAESASAQRPYRAIDRGTFWEVESVNTGPDVPMLPTRTRMFFEKASGRLLGWMHEAEFPVPRP